MFGKYFHAVCGFSFHSFSNVFYKTSFHFDKLQFINFSSCAFGVISKKFVPGLKSKIFSLTFSSINLIVLDFTFQCMIGFELLFV